MCPRAFRTKGGGGTYAPHFPRPPLRSRIPLAALARPARLISLEDPILQETILMKFTSIFAIGIALALGGVSVAAPAYAAQEEGQAERKYAFSDAARPALAELQKAMQGTDAAAFQAALAKAQAAAQTSHTRPRKNERP